MADIIIVEDNEEIGILLQDFLHAEGYDTYLAASGEEALSVYEDEGAKMVLLDIMLPGMDGFAVCHKIREKNNTPVFIISAKNTKDDKLNGLLQGADDYIEKPYDVDILIAKINGLFKRRYSSDEIIVGNIKIDKTKRLVYRDGEQVQVGVKEYELSETSGYIYRIDYRMNNGNGKNIYIVLNIVLIIGFVVVFSILLYIKNKILRPFNELVELPEEIARGNMTASLKEGRNKYFGRFVWGINLLKEQIEDGRKRELNMIKERQVLLLSLSHDIKTPLSAIKLYSKALGRNLYPSEEKRQSVIKSIGDKADEIEGYVSDIVRASGEEFMEFEVIQNIIENAMKYGDGKRISLLTENGNSEYKIKISNSGCTLAEGELPHIFDSFFRGSNVERKMGSGLGLYICRRLIYLMEGEITADINEKSGEREMCVTIVLKKY